MKYMNMKKRLLPLNLQLFAEGEGGSDGDDAGGDDQDDEESDEDGDDEAAEKKYTEKEMEDAVQKRIEREKRKWRRAQKQTKSGGKKSGNNASGKEDDGEEDEETRELREKAAKAEDLELKWTCLEHDVDKSCVDDVLALAKVHMAKNDDMDIEDAIDEVLKKYPQFKVASEGGDDDPEDRKSWGQRHNKPPKKAETVDDAIRNQLFGK